MRDRTLALICLACLATVGCSHTDTVRQGEPGLSLRSSVPLDGARPKLEAARALDPSLRLGFYSVPTTADGADPALDGVRAVAADSWDLPGRDAYREGEWLVVIQTPDVHDRIGPWATDRRRAIAAATDLIQSEIRILTFEGGAAPVIARLGLERVDGGADATSVAYFADDAAVAEILGAADVEMVAAPRLATMDGQRGSVSILSQRAYVSDYEVFHIDEDWIADPVIDVLQDGIMVDVTAKVLEGERVDLDATVEISEFLRFDDERIEIDPSMEPVTIQMPRMRTMRFAQNTVLADGGSILVGRTGEPDGREIWVLLRAQRIARP